MEYPYLTIDLDKIEKNCRTVTTLCRRHDIEVAGVTKVTCGMPKIARALIRGGVKQIADSRLDNIERMRRSGIRSEMLLLRIPMLSEVERVIALTDISLNSEMITIKALSLAARRQDKRHRIILMVDIGDLREGILPYETMQYVENVLELEGVELVGIGTNLACLGGVQPSTQNLSLLCALAEEIRRHFGIPLPIVSGGNTFSLPLLVSGQMPRQINHLRIGAGILLSASPTPDELGSRLSNDAFQIHGEVIELKNKPSRPYGETGEDAFGNIPEFGDDERTMKRAILGFGRADVMPQWLYPQNKGVKVIGASSDHLIVDVTEMTSTITLGSELVFNLEYGALLRVMTSPYVAKRPLLRREKLSHRAIHLIGVFTRSEDESVSEPSSLDYLCDNGLIETLQGMNFDVVDNENIKSKIFPTSFHLSKPDIADRVLQNISNKIISLFIGPPLVLPGIIDGVNQIIDEFGTICFTADGDVLSTMLKNSVHTPSISCANNLVLVGVRDLTFEQERIIEQASITVFTIDDIDRQGLIPVMKKTLDIAGQAVLGIHVSFDMMVVDGTVAPGVPQAEPGGLQYREVHAAMEMIAESQLMLSVNLSNIEPDKDVNGKTAQLGINLIASLLGRKVAKNNKVLAVKE